jgi:imidazolonepropionase-like amidohydrolase
MKLLPEIGAGLALVAVLAVAVGRGDADAAASGPALPSDGNRFAVREVRVFDGERVLPRANVIIEDGRISALGEGIAVPAGLPVIEGEGMTLMPGLIDAHVHSWGEAQREALPFGVTAELDMMGDWKRIPALREQRESLEATDQADLWTAGAAVTAPGGHGTQFGLPVPSLPADGDAVAFVRERVAEGSDYIKLIVEDMSVYGGTRRLPTLTPAQVSRAIEAAHADKRLAVVHASSQANALHGVEAGADGLVHVFQDEAADDALVEAMRRRNAFVVPTLSVIASIAGAGAGQALEGDARLQPWLDAAQRESLKGGFGPVAHPEYLERALRSVRRLHQAGVAVLAGTDAGNPGTAHGASLHGELELLVRAGLSPTQALAAATSVPAKRFGLQDRGRIAPGLRADLVLVQGDPTADITATRAIVGVWKNGYAVQRPRASAAPAAAALDTQTLISDFEQGDAGVQFGSAWTGTTDAMAGGASTVEQTWIEGGAGGSRGALRLSGEIRPGFAFPWAGTMFHPASVAMQPVDASARSELVLQMRGDGRRYSVMLFSGASANAMPSIQVVTPGPEWGKVRLALADFRGADLTRLRGIAITAGQPQGGFSFAIDQVELR